MTAPNQTSPDGAITVGGGEFGFGQLITENTHRSGVTLAAPTDLTGALEMLPEVLAWLPPDALGPWKAFLGMADGSTVQDIIDGIMSGLGTNSLNTIIEKVGETIDGLVRGFLGWIDSGFSPQNAEDAAKRLADSVTALAAAVAALQQNSAGFSGVAEYINFGSYTPGSSMGADWSQSYWGSGTGTLGIDGNRLKWLGSADNRWGYARYTPKQTKSDYQKIGVAFGTSPSRNIFGGSKSTNRIIGRCSSDMSSYVMVDFTADSFTLGVQVSYAYTFLASNPSPFTFKAGAIYWLECGTQGGARIYRVWENNRILLTFTDSGALTPVGASYRFVGLAVKAFNDTYKPAEAAAMAFFDNTPAPILGSGWRLSRTNTSVVNQNSGDNLFPGGHFDTVDYISDDVTYDASSNKVTVAATGWYQINVCQYSANTIAVGGGVVGSALYRNGTLAQQAATVAQNALTGSNGFAGTFIQYLQAGDYVQPGYYSSWDPPNQFNADAGGVKTYWSGVFLGTNRKPATT